MYENYTYEQIKALPDTQKIEALKELKILYPENKDLAQHWNVIPMAISNMVAKYLEGKQLGRKKMTPEEKLQKAKERKLKKEQEEKLAKQETINQESKDSVPQPTTPNATVVPVVNQPIQSTNTTSFSIKLQKDILGEEATAILGSIANTLLKEGKYKVSLSVEELEV
jgi:hypothetical protein